MGKIQKIFGERGGYIQVSYKKIFVHGKNAIITKNIKMLLL